MEVEVFKTDVIDPEKARWLVDQIQKHFMRYKVNFDLADCDRILRVEYDGVIKSDELIDLLKRVGCTAEILSDNVQTILPIEFLN